MGLNFRKSFKVAPGVKLNVGKKSAGLSFGSKHGGVSVNSKTGTRVRVSVPGTGISYTQKIGGSSKKSSCKTPHKTVKVKNAVPPSNRPQKPKWYTRTGWIIFFLIILPPVGVGMMWAFKKDAWSAKKKFIITAISAIWFLIALVLGNSSEETELATIETDYVTTPETTTETESETEAIDEFGLINQFINSYNSYASEPITDIEEMDIQGDDYRTEFRLNAYADAVGLKGVINGNEIEIINYGNFKNDLLRIYADTDSYDSTVEIYTTILKTINSSITDEEIQASYETLKDSRQSNIILSEYDVQGYITYQEIMLDCRELSFMQ